jgi:outer membrane protein assembly factor BamB
MFDAMTGKYILSIVNGTSMTLTEDEGGNLIGYYINASTANAYNARTLNEWNSTRCMPSSAASFSWSPPQNAILPFDAGIMWSKPLATNFSGAALPAPLSFGPAGTALISGNVVLLFSQSSAGVGQGFTAGWEIEAGYSLDTGAQLWITNRTETPFTRLAGASGNPPIGPANGVYVEINQNTASIIGYSVFTGAQLWGPITLPNTNPYDSIGGYYGTPANGVLYLWGYGGDIYAISLTNGTILWSTSTTQILGASGSDTPYGVWPLWTWDSSTVAGGMLYIPIGHEYAPPLFRGAQLLALNTTTGQLVWSILGFNVNAVPAIVDGVMVDLNAYDNQLYAYGMGASKTTVTAPSVGVSTATPVTITGSVTDLSSGSQQEAVAANFPNGLPCVSDASMSHFMEAVYMQQPMPNNTTGVPVTFTVLDANGNQRTIGTTTTNALGDYSFTWTPDIPGNYTIYATFAGTQSYYGSSASTGFYASSPAPTASPYPTVSLSPTGTAIAEATAAIIIAIAIGFAITILVLRKRP